MLDKDIIEEARGYLDKDKWHLTSIYDSEEDNYCQWKLFRKYKDDMEFYYSPFNNPILTSEDYSAEDLLEFAKEYGGVKINNNINKQDEIIKKHREYYIEKEKANIKLPGHSYYLGGADALGELIEILNEAKKNG